MKSEKGSPRLSWSTARRFLSSAIALTTLVGGLGQAVAASAPVWGC